MGRNNGRWKDLDVQCRHCVHLRVMSLYMDGTHVYCCGTYPLRNGEKCPKFERINDEDDEGREDE